MKILKNDGKFKILSKTENIIEAIALSARVCYQSQELSTPESDLDLVKKLIERQHDAMLEFADMTVVFDDVSRGLSHELVRHRIASFAQESSRRVDESDFKVVVPPNQNEKDPVIFLTTEDSNGGKQFFNLNLEQWFNFNEQAYRSLRSNKYLAEDARQVLPTAIKSQIVVKANMREWRKILSLRCDKSAHWEIRAVMCDLLDYCRDSIPVLFDDFFFFNSDKLGRYARIVLSPVVLAGYLEDFFAIGNSIEDITKLSPSLLEQISCKNQ
jgi:thymidylate synthase (FAD)